MTLGRVRMKRPWVPSVGDIFFESGKRDLIASNKTICIFVPSWDKTMQFLEGNGAGLMMRKQC
jgi:hypothetical protein